MKKIALLITIVLIAINSQAKIWRVNNNPGVTADFTNTDLAVASASVVRRYHTY
jgi:hypothetical protein